MVLKMESKNNYFFIINTEQYAGNFEREMCAYLTGCVGECEVGEEYAEMFKKDFPDQLTELGDSIFWEIIEKRSDDDNGCRRPVNVFYTPGWFNNGVGGEFREGQEEEAKKHRRDFYLKLVKECEQGIRENTENTENNLLDVDVEKEHEALLEERQKALQESEFPLNKFPAFLSVCIFFSKKPTDEMIEIMKNRALSFPKVYRSMIKYNKEMTITGFRLIEEKILLKEVVE